MARQEAERLLFPLLRKRAGGFLSLHPLFLFAVLFLLIWQFAVFAFAPPSYLVPAPFDVVRALIRYRERLGFDAMVTLLEIVLGLVSGIVLGLITGLLTASFRLFDRLLTPLLLISQALPVFALAPLFVLWFGFGLLSKVLMAAIIIYFPVASALSDGLRRTDPGLLDLARLNGARAWQTLFYIRFPAALPALVTGIRVAAVVAPIGAVIGEWVGASHGLGLLMIEANARQKTDLLFAALLLLGAAAIALRALVDRLARRLVFWAEREKARV